jgi:hypothetical protein
MRLETEDGARLQYKLEASAPDRGTAALGGVALPTWGC